MKFAKCWCRGGSAGGQCQRVCDTASGEVMATYSDLLFDPSAGAPLVSKSDAGRTAGTRCFEGIAMVACFFADL